MPSQQETARFNRGAQQFIAGYVAAMLWSSTDDNDEPLDASYTATAIHPDSMRDVIQECRDFYRSNRHLWRRSHDEAAGHCFWLNRNHHGTGFWDHEREFGMYAEHLSTLAIAQGEREPYIGDDGRIHLYKA